MRKDSTTKKEQGSPLKHSTTFLVLTVIMIVVTLLSNIVANRLFVIGAGGIALTSDLLLFSISYIISDVISEVYGYRSMKICLWLTLLLNLGMMIFFQIVNALPVPEGMQFGEYNVVLGSTFRIIIASTLAYFAGNFSDSITISILKKVTKGKHLWMRTIGSSMIGQVFDTGVFMLVAFTGILPFVDILQMAGMQWIIKILYETVMTPITYRVVAWCKKKENLDVYDYGVSYNPFAELASSIKKK